MFSLLKRTIILACSAVLIGFGGCGIGGVDVKVHVSPETQAEVAQAGDVVEVLLRFGSVDMDALNDEETLNLRRIGVLCEPGPDDAYFSEYRQWTGPSSPMTVTVFLVPSDRPHLECGNWPISELVQGSRDLLDGAISIEGFVEEGDYEDGFAVLDLRM